jgi:hypothetical protein
LTFCGKCYARFFSLTPPFFTDENASDLAIALFTLQDNFELEGFETMRIKALIALIVSCPTKAAPYVPVQKKSHRGPVGLK